VTHSSIGQDVLRRKSEKKETSMLSLTDINETKANSCMDNADSNPRNDAETGHFSTRGTFYRLHSNSENAHKRTSLLIMYLNWSFETSFLMYFVSALAIFLVIVLIFTLLLASSTYITGEESCVEKIDGDFPFEKRFFASMALSWTTFTTVGYGNIYPLIRKQCFLMNIVSLTGAFVGVLYAGFCGAILFGKVQSTFSNALVIFSDICVIRYGQGSDQDNFDINDNDDDDDLSSGHETATAKPPATRVSHAISLFRVVNDFDVNDHDDQDTFDVKVNGDSSGKREIATAKPPSANVPHPILVFRVVNERANQIKGNITNLSVDAVGVIEKWHPSAHDSSEMVAKRRFHQISIEPSSLPVFVRISHFRHVLDENSCLLNIETRKMIKRNHGKWPPSIDSAKKIRETLQFESIIVSLEGVSSVSKSTVYSQKTYQQDEIRIGWRFIDITHKEQDRNGTRYAVNLDLINVVTEQVGGGCDALTEEDALLQT